MNGLWNRLLILLRLRFDPDRTPPAFPSVPHPYDSELNGKQLACCALCGGGEKHQIHTGYFKQAAGEDRGNCANCGCLHQDGALCGGGEKHPIHTA